MNWVVIMLKHQYIQQITAKKQLFKVCRNQRQLQDVWLDQEIYQGIKQVQEIIDIFKTIIIKYMIINHFWDWQ